MMSVALGLLASLGAAPPHLPAWPARLETEVEAIARGFDGRIHFFAEDRAGGGRYGFNAHTPAYLASGIKLAVMLALYQELAAGRAELSETLVFRAVDVRDGSPLTSYLRPDTPVPLGVLLEAMIQSSDNGATDALIRRLGLERVNRALPEAGLGGFGPITSLLDVRRLVYGKIDPRGARLSPGDVFALALARPVPRRLEKLDALLGRPRGSTTPAAYHRAYVDYYAEGWNSASMWAMGKLLGRMVDGTLVSPEASRAMLEVLRGTRTGLRRFRAGLPDGLELAHKTGTQHRRVCDFGVVFLPDGRAVILAASVTGRSASAADDVLARLASATLSALAPELVGPASARR